MKKIVAASTVLMVVPNLAHAAENSPQVIILSTIAFLVFVGIVLLFQMSASKEATNPSNENFADQNSILYKLNHRIDQNSTYKISVYRQSENIERVEGPISGKNVAEKILTSMRRASITAVSISNHKDGIDVRRAIYNGRGRQEGKRIGSYLITEILSPKTHNPTVPIPSEESAISTANGNIKVFSSSESEAAIIKSWYRIEDQISPEKMKPTRDFLQGFDKKSGVGRSEISQVDFFVFLSFVDKYLAGEAKITPSVRAELSESDAPHHQSILADSNREKMRGIEAFNANPKEIQEKFREWYSYLQFSDQVKENRPQTLTITL